MALGWYAPIETIKVLVRVEGKEHLDAALARGKGALLFMAHFTCLDKSNKDVENELMLLHYLGIQNIMALRGDPPWGQKEFKAAKDGY